MAMSIVIHSADAKKQCCMAWDVGGQAAVHQPPCDGPANENEEIKSVNSSKIVTLTSTVVQCKFILKAYRF